MVRPSPSPCARPLWLTVLVVWISVSLSFAQSRSQSGGLRPWMDSQLSPDQRATLALKEMTMDEKISLLHGTGSSGLSPVSP